MAMYKVSCLTPKGKALQAEKSFRNVLVGSKGKIIKTVVVDDSEFHWIVELDEKELFEVVRRVADADVKIKRFYRLIMRLTNRYNVLVGKSKWAGRKAKNWLIKRYKQLSGQEVLPFDDSEFEEGGALKFCDEAEMRALLDSELLTVEEYKDEEDKK